MSRLASRIFPLFVLGALLVWFSVMTVRGVFSDPDAFYHAHLSEWIWQHGTIDAFPWLDLTTLARYPVDQHHLYHRLLGPAVATFGAFEGTQIMAVVFGAFAMTVLWSAIRQLGAAAGGKIVASSLVLATLLVPEFTARMMVPKASSLAVALYVATIAAMLLRRPFLLALAGAAFTWTHGGWSLLILTAAAILGAELASSLRRERSVSRALHAAPWRAFATLIAGITAGLLLHPYRDEILPFLRVQIVEVAIGAPKATMLAREWRPPRPAYMAKVLFPLFVVFVAWAATALAARRRGLLRTTASTDESAIDRPHDAFVLAAPVVLTALLTARSQRFVEYLVPSVALWIGSLWGLLDLAGVAAHASGWLRRRGRRFRFAIVAAAVTAVVVPVGWQASVVYQLARRYQIPFDVYREPMAVLSAHAASGDRVFNPGWDDFPILFAADDRLRFVWGLDPAFLFDANPALAARVEAVARGRAEDLRDVIAREAGARFVFLGPARFPVLDAQLHRDPRFREIARDEAAAVYEVREFSKPESATRPAVPLSP